MPFVTQLECANCGDRYPEGEVHNLSTACGKPLWVRYDLEAVSDRNGRVVVFNTGAAQKYPEAVQEQLPAIDLAKPIPWDEI